MKRTMDKDVTQDTFSLPPIGTSSMMNDKSSYNLNKFIDEYSGSGKSGIAGGAGSNLYKTPDRARF